jgi:hypothetical protein
MIWNFYLLPKVGALRIAPTIGLSDETPLGFSEGKIAYWNPLGFSEQNLECRNQLGFREEYTLPKTVGFSERNIECRNP